MVMPVFAEHNYSYKVNSENLTGGIMLEKNALTLHVFENAISDIVPNPM